MSDLTKETANNPLKIQSLSTKGNIIDFFLPFEINKSEDFIDFRRAVGEAEATDLIRVHIDCCGGDVCTALILHDILKNTSATVEISIEGFCASAATLIALSGDQWEILEHARIMIHSWSGAFYGKWNEQEAKFHSDEEYFVNMYKKIYKGFLTDQEIEDSLNGKDFWFTAKEAADRLSKFKEKDIKRQQLIDKITREQQEEVNKKLNAALLALDKEENTKRKKTK